MVHAKALWRDSGREYGQSRHVGKCEAATTKVWSGRAWGTGGSTALGLLPSRGLIGHPSYTTRAAGVLVCTGEAHDLCDQLLGLIGMPKD
jgi:hypothetical protein